MLMSRIARDRKSPGFAELLVVSGHGFVVSFSMHSRSEIAFHSQIWFSRLFATAFPTPSWPEFAASAVKEFVSRDQLVLVGVEG